MTGGDMTPNTLDITRKRGDTFPFVIQLKDSAGSPINITGYTFKLTLDESADPPDNTTLLFTNVPTVSDGPNGKITVTLSGGQADHVGVFHYDLQWTDLGGAIRTVLQGKWVFDQDITK